VLRPINQFLVPEKEGDHSLHQAKKKKETVFKLGRGGNGKRGKGAMDFEETKGEKRLYLLFFFISAGGEEKNKGPSLLSPRP